jgi:hypothetical protein
MLDYMGLANPTRLLLNHAPVVDLVSDSVFVAVFDGALRL